MTSSTFDIELPLLLEAVYRKYHYDFRGYAAASLKRRLTQAMERFGCRTLSQLQDRLLHEPALFPALLDFLTVQVSEMFRDPPYFRALREKVVPLLRTYPSLKVWVAGCSTGRGGLLAGHPAAGGGTAGALAHLCDGHQRQRPGAGAGGHLRCRAHQRLHGEPPQVRGAQLLVGLLHGRVRQGGIRQVAQDQHRVRRPQPVHRQRVLGSAARFLPQRAHLFRSRSCRTGCWDCSGTRCVARDFWAWGRRSRCASRHTPMLSPTSCRATRSSRRRRRERRPGRSRAEIDAVVIGASAGGVEVLSALLPDCRRGLSRFVLHCHAHSARAAEPAARGVRDPVRVAGQGGGGQGAGASRRPCISRRPIITC